MYSYTKNQIEVHQDDILTIQSLYPERLDKTPTQKTPNSAPQICGSNVNTFLILNQLTYVFYEKLLWIVDHEGFKVYPLTRKFKTVNITTLRNPLHPLKI